MYVCMYVYIYIYTMYTVAAARELTYADVRRLGGSPENLEAMLLMMANKYVYEGQKSIEVS